MREIKEFDHQDHPCTILAELHGHYVDFYIYEGKDSEWDADMEPWIDGSIKWDGCSNWQVHGHYPIHFCSKGESKMFSELFQFLYFFAAELMPEHEKNLGDDKYGPYS